MEGIQEAQQMIRAAGDFIINIIRQLLGFRSMLGLVDTVAGMLSAWCEPLLFRDMGERKVRAWPLLAVSGSILWSIIGTVLTVICLIFIDAMEGQGQGTHVASQQVSRLTAQELTFPLVPILTSWGIGLGICEWLSAMARRKTEAEEGYCFSRFIGWTRFLPAMEDGSYWQQAILFFLIGFNLVAWGIDIVGGGVIMVSALAVLTRLWVIRARRREDAMDLLDNEWVARQVTAKASTMGGTDITDAAVQTAQVVSTATFVNRWSQ